MQPGTGYAAEMGPLPPPSRSTLPTLPALQCSREAQKPSSSPWKRRHANSKLSDHKRVRALPWQEKPLKILRTLAVTLEALFWQNLKETAWL